MGAAAGQSNDRWSSCADGYYQANDNDTNVNDIEIITIIQWQIKELCKWLQLPAQTCSSLFSTGWNLKTV